MQLRYHVLPTEAFSEEGIATARRIAFALALGARAQEQQQRTTATLALTALRYIEKPIG
jgi:hypothetical protein